MEKEEVSAGKYVSVGGITLVPILRTTVVCLSGRRGTIGFGTREAVGVVVVSPEGNRAINISGEEVPMEEYAVQVPEVAALLRSTLHSA